MERMKTNKDDLVTSGIHFFVALVIRVGLVVFMIKVKADRSIARDVDRIATAIESTVRYSDCDMTYKKIK